MSEFENNSISKFEKDYMYEFQKEGILVRDIKFEDIEILDILMSNRKKTETVYYIEYLNNSIKLEKIGKQKNDDDYLEFLTKSYPIETNLGENDFSHSSTNSPGELFNPNEESRTKLKIESSIKKIEDDRNCSFADNDENILHTIHISFISEQPIIPTTDEQTSSRECFLPSSIPKSRIDLLQHNGETVIDSDISYEIHTNQFESFNDIKKYLFQVKRIIYNSCNKYNVIIYLMLNNNNYFSINIRIEINIMLLMLYENEKIFNNVIILNFVFLPYDILNFISQATENESSTERSVNEYLKTLKFKRERYYILNFTNILKVVNYSNIVPKKEIKSIGNIRLFDKDNIIQTIIDFIEERRCGFGRLKQLSGTCWLNAVMNGFFLSKITRKFLIDKTKKLIIYPNNKQTFEYIYENKDKLTIENIISSIIYNIYIMRIRLKTSINIMQILADKIEEKFDNFFTIFFSDMIEEYAVDTLVRYIGRKNIELKSIFIERIDLKNFEKIITLNETNGFKYAFSIINVGDHIIIIFSCNRNYYLYDSNEKNIIKIRDSEHLESLYITNYEKYIRSMFSSDVIIKRTAIPWIDEALILNKKQFNPSDPIIKIFKNFKKIKMEQSEDFSESDVENFKKELINDIINNIMTKKYVTRNTVCYFIKEKIYSPQPILLPLIRLPTILYQWWCSFSSTFGNLRIRGGNNIKKKLKTLRKIKYKKRTINKLLTFSPKRSVGKNEFCENEVEAKLEYSKNKKPILRSKRRQNGLYLRYAPKNTLILRRTTKRSLKLNHKTYKI